MLPLSKTFAPGLRASPMLAALAFALSIQPALANDVEDQLADYLNGINAELSASGAGYLAVMAEYVTIDVAGKDQANTVIAKDVGNKRLDLDFVPFDARRPWGDPGGGITYPIDTTGDAVPFAGGLTQAETDAAIVRGMDSWDALNCSNLPLVRNPDGGLPLGVIAGEFLAADIQHAGWRDIEFPGGILGVTFTFGFCAPCAPTPVWTDIDNNGYGDTAFREIYYDPFQGFFGPPRVWSDDGVSNVDVETVALHEAGHGLGQAHFGKVFIDKKGRLKFAPEAVMNAVYVGPRRGLLGTDNGGHCANWGNWPNN